MLWACLQASRGYLSIRCQTMDTAKPNMLCVQAFDYMYTFLTALKLMTLQVPGWDPRQAREELKFDEALDLKIADMYELGRARSTRNFEGYPLGHVPPKEDPFRRLGKKLECLKPILQQELENVSMPVSSPDDE